MALGEFGADDLAGPYLEAYFSRGQNFGILRSQLGVDKKRRKIFKKCLGTGVKLIANATVCD